jgi:hypothetical protein
MERYVVHLPLPTCAILLAIYMERSRREEENFIISFPESTENPGES